MDVLVVEARSMTSSHPQQSGHSLLGDLHEPSRGSDTTAFIEMADDILHCGLWALGVE
jgi:hypothetical protein